jgi:hypothetical protein
MYERIIIMNKFSCKKCGSVSIHIKENGTQVGLYCSDCGVWIKWLGKDDRRLAELQIQNNSTVNVNTDINNYFDTIKSVVDSFVRMCDFIEQNDNIGCKNCPVFNDCFMNKKHNELYKLMNVLNINKL